MRLLNKEQHDYLLSILQGRYNAELAQMMNEKYGLSLTARQLSTYKKNHGLKSGLTGHFQKGHNPVNKGTKGLYNVGGNKTSFKKGQKAHNYKPIGYERIDRDGYVLVKVQDDGPWHKRWKHKHKIVWEETNGPIPSGHKLLFADRDKQNISLDNLILVSNKQMATLNKKGLISNVPDLTRTGVILADIYQKMSERKKAK
ncbi:HNH endonuclease signature motif containing protein [Halalkalibacterium ligniniphilum]|uniref:HNH endonuclease signature motif containing protein n=1 Tax=Halalkalibacterium ligniniphilum TaxID=1134413 RepID=UPI00034B5017|nr:HNH endonuclease signature motif containing protein [Halalkalibacterium ligniniphilum]